MERDRSPSVTASFSSSNTTTTRRQTITSRQTPLLRSTPPQITRTLTNGYPFVVPLNQLAGLLSWTTENQWNSFLLVASFWFTVLYGEWIIKWTGPLIVTATLITAMYYRRYSPLSSRQQEKTLDDIVSTFELFNTRCQVLLDPFSKLTDFLSTQQTATSATTRPALTTLFTRILIASPLWWFFAWTLNTRRVILLFGTLVLTWHSRPARISRIILWRSRFVRRTFVTITSLDVDKKIVAKAKTPPSSYVGIYENQRRWLGIGWTTSMLAYERAAWTDEMLEETTSPQDYKLAPGQAWTEPEWKVDDWVYYDNKWKDGQTKDGWGRYTRQRRWSRRIDGQAVVEKKEKKQTQRHNRSKSFAYDDTGSSSLSRAGMSNDENDTPTPTAILKEKEAEWGLGDDVIAGLG
ncbi:hypothetical protein AAFC00_007255 [Neodothiora populina]|uniref:Peroxin/Ferlin domain-containing protein n=1 Tax=Neodothiora populina TaxID=2781224 RepID=A0ABR3PIT7_9PEZI